MESVADIERALQVTLREYQHPTEARTFYAPYVEPSLDLAAPVLPVTGLENFFFTAASGQLAGWSSRARDPRHPPGGSEGGEYIGNDFRAAYVPGVRPLDGTGQLSPCWSLTAITPAISRIMKLWPICLW